MSCNRPTAEAAGKQSQQPQPTYSVRSARSSNLRTGLLFRCGFGSREVPARPWANRCARAAAARPKQARPGSRLRPSPRPGRETEPPGAGPPPRPGPLTGRCEARLRKNPPPASEGAGAGSPRHRQHRQTGLPPSRRHKTGYEMPARMARFGEGATVGFQKAVFVLPPPQSVARGLGEGTGWAPLSRLVFLVEVYGAPPP